MTGRELCQLQQILFAAGETTYLAAQGIRVKAVAAQVVFHMHIGFKTDIKEFGMQVVNLGQLSNFSGALLEKRLLNAKLEAEKKAKEEAEKKAKEEADKKAKEAGADAAADATKPADAAAADAAKPADAAADAAKPADAAAPAAAN